MKFHCVWTQKDLKKVKSNTSRNQKRKNLKLEDHHLSKFNKSSPRPQNPKNKNPKKSLKRVLDLNRRVKVNQTSKVKNELRHNLNQQFFKFKKIWLIMWSEIWFQQFLKRQSKNEKRLNKRKFSSSRKYYQSRTLQEEFSQMNEI